jgi:membrane-associated protein
MNLAIVLPGVIIAAILGAETGYTIGHRAGPRLFNRPESRLFRKEFVERARHHFERYGPTKAVILARFVPIVRTFLNPMAGVVEMDRRQFTMANIAGGFLWAGGVTLLGFLLGERIDNVDRYLLPIIAVVIAVSLVPVVLEVLKSRRQKRAAALDREAA